MAKGMSWFRTLRFRLRALVARRAVDRELDEEIRFHLEMETEEGIKRGLSPREARRRAYVHFGGVEGWKQTLREERGVRWLEDIGRDLAFAVRGLGRNPGFALAAVVTLALGIGANTAVFSVVDGVLLSPIPFERPDELVVVWETDRDSGTVREPASVPDYLDFARRSQTLAELAAFQGRQLNLSIGTGDPERVNALAVTTNYFDLLGVRPLLGHGFEGGRSTGDESGTPGVAAPDLVLLSERFWRARLRADPAVAGTTLRIDGTPVTVAGVMPSSADFGVGQVLGRADYGRSFAEDGRSAVDVWVPYLPDPATSPRQTHPILQVGRLAPEGGVGTPRAGTDASGTGPGVPRAGLAAPSIGIAAAQAELGEIAADLETTYPDANSARGVHVEALADVVLGPVRPALLVLLGAVALVLLAACVNVANLLLARGAARGREVAVRTALGAGSARLAGQFLAESVLLTALATLTGVGVAFGGLRLLLALAPADLPRLDGVHVDLRVLGATVAVAVVVAVVFAVVPLAQTRSRDLEITLKGDGGRATAAGDRSRARGALVVAEVALAALLAIGATLLIRSFWEVSAVDPGFRTAGVLRAEVELPETRYPEDYSTWPSWPAHHRFVDGVLRRLEARPEVTAAAVAGAHPLAAGFTNSWAVVGREAESRDWPEISMRLVSPGYLATVGLPLAEGRAIDPGDTARSPRVALVNRTAATRYFPDGSPLGHEIMIWGRRWRVVGVVGDERIHGLDAPVPPAAYLALAQAPSNSATILVRTAGDPAALAPAVRRAVHETDPQLAVFDVEPLTATLGHSLAARRFLVTVLAVFAAVALVLAIVGVHGVLSYGVARRAPELGIRMALGASRRQVMGMVVLEGLRLAMLGLVVGLASAAALARLIAGLLFQTTPHDPLVFAVVALAILLTTALACLAPSRRAARADPAEVLRAE